MSFGQFVALFAFILSMGSIALTYGVASVQETAAICNPFIDGCTDITHTGMKGDAGFIFRGGMISACIFFVFWWLIMNQWLKPYTGTVSRGFMQFFGILAALGLLAGTAVLLPVKDEIPWAVHVRGANLFFQGMLIALTINYVLILKAKRQGLLVPSFKAKTALIAVLWFMFIAYAGVTVGIEMTHGNRIVEWWATLFIGIYFLTPYWDWNNVRIAANNAS